MIITNFVVAHTLHSKKGHISSWRRSVKSSRFPIGNTSDWSHTTRRTRTPPSPRSSPCFPRSAPNILVVLLDDVGFGASSAFGGPVHNPTAERLQRDGLTYNRFHTTALCAPTAPHCSAAATIIRWGWA